MAEIDAAQARRTARILWLALLASQGVYVAILLSGAATVRVEALELPALPIALAAVAFGTGIGAHLLWRRATGAGRPIHAGQPEPASAFNFYLLAWVLDGSVALYGLVLGLLAYPPTAWAPFSLAALVLMLVHRPA